MQPGASREVVHRSARLGHQTVLQSDREGQQILPAGVAGRVV